MDKIITDPIFLHQKCRETTHEEILDLQLELRIRLALKLAWTTGLGLAAIQIGVPVRFAWYMYEGKSGQLVNPVIIGAWGSDIRKEGCLSIPGKWLNIERPWTISYIGGARKRKKRKISGMLARLIQHEIDHMEGILVTEKATE